MYIYTLYTIIRWYVRHGVQLFLRMRLEYSVRFGCRAIHSVLLDINIIKFYCGLHGKQK